MDFCKKHYFVNRHIFAEEEFFFILFFLGENLKINIQFNYEINRMR